MPDLDLTPRAVTRRITLRLLGFRRIDGAWMGYDEQRSRLVRLTEEQLDTLSTRQWNHLVRQWRRVATPTP
jgi:hypothetical protein